VFEEEDVDDNVDGILGTILGDTVFVLEGSTPLDIVALDVYVIEFDMVEVLDPRGVCEADNNNPGDSVVTVVGPDILGTLGGTALP